MIKKLSKKISFILAFVMLLTSTNVFAASAITYKESVKHFVGDSDKLYVELTEFDGVLTYYYQDYENDDVIVITKSQEAGIEAYYNNGTNVFQIKNLNMSNSNNLDEKAYFENLTHQILYNSSDIDYTILDFGSNLYQYSVDNNITPYGITNSKQYFINQTGSPYSDRLVASDTINNKQVEIFENKTHEIYEVNRLAATAGKGIGVVLGALSMPKSIATAIGIVTFVKDGVEYLKYPCTILKYKASLHYYKDVTVNGRTTHEVQRRNVYDLWENDNNYELDFKFGDEDPHFGNNTKLMQIGVDNYF